MAMAAATATILIFVNPALLAPTGAHDQSAWVDPSFTAEVEYRDITSEGLLRQSLFKGLQKELTIPERK
jgi:ATP-dependent DNA ligase